MYKFFLRNKKYEPEHIKKFNAPILYYTREKCMFKNVLQRLQLLIHSH